MRPDALRPTTVSADESSLEDKSRAPADSESSAPSLAVKTADSPPAMRACTVCGSVLYVGGHSAASKIPSRPEVPAPT